MPSAPDFAAQFAERLNLHCFCVGTDIPGLLQRMQSDLVHRGVSQPLIESHPHLFSAAPVFIAEAQLAQIRNTVQAIESVVATPQWHDAVLGNAPAIAQKPVPALGVFLGYDFHLGADGVSLIEINTNAGGAFLNTAMMQAQQACCDGVRDLLGSPVDADGVDARLAAMFMKEWQRSRGDQPLRLIAIVDSTPETQYLYPEFLLFKNLMSAHGIDVVIADPGDLVLQSGQLVHAQGVVDLVYNRLTDFYFTQPEHAHLRDAYAADAAVFTPHPHAHALYADKRNLILLSDVGRLAGWGVPNSTLDVLKRHVPSTVAVTVDNAASLWQDRKHWFFKPSCGFGSRGAYRGDKMTHKVFAGIEQGGYVAQRLVPPSERTARLVSGDVELKLDVRAYVYEGEVQLFAARLYQGQTTNFRTPGGGFAPVYRAPDAFAITTLGNKLQSECGGMRGKFHAI